MRHEGDLTHHSLPITPYSIVIVIIIVIEGVLFDEIQLDGIEPDDLECYSALFTIHGFAFVRVHINMNIGVAFRTRSSRHFSYLH
jgi:hypothetical protein